MMKQALILLALTLTATVRAGCPNQCSGHGICGANDVCTCHRNWEFSDCSGRKCPMKKSWADIKDTTVTGRGEHYYAECSGKGTCDSETGLCECYEGFSGKGCERLDCPDNCNNHGVCELMSTVNSGYTAWDASKIQVCNCDAGYEGSACEKRKCPRGDDPMTLYSASTVLEVNEQQTIQLATATSGEFVLTFTDSHGQSYTTHAIDLATCTATTVKLALEALPNQVIPSVSVTFTSGSAAGADLLITVEFSDAANAGDVVMLAAGTAGCTANGCQPAYSGLGGSYLTVAESVTGTKESAVCSNRGLCDSEFGKCTCHEGFTGEACETQTIIT